ncbi:adenine nucleotide transporter BT1, chloroplastic/mitochondrial-like [Selaginella moellendorffii]|uniref:adenine nucleotide transporter BT1, chloroplastic/mitochondrial-like n=1 Tax=Selaginella moellendorffii TaxID=88036 RepID=UPI000D1C3143|nr:adenine nucleotide transporter BT1, chloroplastic/mitochondrial-like [Selaginella moellendorffii]|eukprot:XP_024533448.1 adenine nucleotide transporter BT1, chloroplastic/mitochondrial-like [Selaginella moellendorffii]
MGSGGYNAALLCLASIGNTWSDGYKDPKETVQHLRIPVPETTVPFLGFVKSLALKHLICGTIAGAVSSASCAPLGAAKTRVIARRGGTSTSEVLTNLSKKPGGILGLFPASLSSWMMMIFIGSLKRGVQFLTFESVKRSEERRHTRDPKVVPLLPREVSISTLSGALSAVTSLLTTYPFNTIQDRLMLQPEDYSSTFSAFGKVLREEGVRGLYTGLGPELLRMVPSAAAEFYAYEALKSKFLDPATKNIGVVASLAIGAAAGALSTTLTYPLELARKELSLSAVPNTALHFSSTWDVLRAVSAREGFRGLYRGLELDLLQIVPPTAVSFAVYEVMKRVLIAVAEEKRNEVK